MKKTRIRKLRQEILAQKRDATYHRKHMEYHEETAKMLETELEEVKKEVE